MCVCVCLCERERGSYLGPIREGDRASDPEFGIRRHAPATAARGGNCKTQSKVVAQLS